jgi:Tfp pilus assembly protein PilN
MIKINLFDYREELNRAAIQKRVFKSLSIVATVLAMILFSWLIEKSRISAVDMEVRDLEQQVNALQGEVNQVKSMQGQQRRVSVILKGIEGLRNDQLPATQILFDVNQGVPETIWLTDIMQKSASDLENMQVPTILFDDSDGKTQKNNKSKNAGPKTGGKEFLQISGHALEDQAVARFVERLEEISYFKLVFLFKTEQTRVGQTPVRAFTIFCHMPKSSDKTVT